MLKLPNSTLTVSNYFENAWECVFKSFCVPSYVFTSPLAM